MGKPGFGDLAFEENPLRGGGPITPEHLEQLRKTLEALWAQSIQPTQFPPRKPVDPR